MLDGTAADDRMFGNGGDDFLTGSDGGDSIFGGNGEDIVFGEDDDDFLRGGADGDALLGGEGNDTLRGDGGDDLLQAIEIFDEAAYLDAVDDAVDNGDDPDDVRVQENFNLELGEADTLHGGFGNDTLLFGSNDEATGGEGADEFIVGDWMNAGEEAIVTDFERGVDTLVYSYAGETEPDVSFTEEPDGDRAEVRIDGEVILLLANVDFSTLTPADVTLLQRDV